MTTPEAAAMYESQHVAEHSFRKTAVFNPHGRELAELPVIYGFNNGGARSFLEAVLISENGSWLGKHLCSSEAYMPHDLGILEGTRPDRHKTFREHYPDGYRMEFVPYDEVRAHKGLQRAFTRARMVD